MTPQAFTIDVPDAALRDLQHRLCNTRLADDLDNRDWRYGVERGWFSGMLEHWAKRFDWRTQEAAMNRLAHYRVEINGVPIHYLRSPGRGPKPLPLLLTHGWPWTFWDWRDVIGPLSDPASHGGDPADAFDLIIPSLPGFGFSSPLTRTDIGVRRIGHLWVRLMQEVIGRERFIAAGGDWGSLISAELGHAHPDRVLGVHLTLPILPGLGARSLTPDQFAPSEQWMAARNAQARPVSDAHILAHRRSAQTLAYAFDDSPAGLAAWMWERRRNWSDRGTGGQDTLDPDSLCTAASLYWFTRTSGSAMRLYAAHAAQGWDPLHRRERVIDVPTAFALAPHELFLIPRAVAEARTRLSRWTILPRGGHFLPAEAPDLLVEEYRAFGRLFR